jgi:hypothetical protein
VAKVDSAALQDGFDLYLHGFIITNDGHWVVVQQGMNGHRRQARRYHWLSEGLRSFVEEPHSAIDGMQQEVIVNLTDRRAEASRRRQLDILDHLGPEDLPHLVMPAHHDVRPEDIVTRRLHSTLRAAAECGPRDFAELLLVPGVGARTVRALAQVAEVVHGAPYRFSDPARFSVAHGGKDRHPFPVPLKVYDRTIDVLKTAVRKARLGHSEELTAIRRWTNRRAGWSRSTAGLRSRCCSPTNANARTNMVAKAYLAMNRHPQRQRTPRVRGNLNRASSPCWDRRVLIGFHAPTSAPPSSLPTRKPTGGDEPWRDGTFLIVLGVAR